MRCNKVCTTASCSILRNDRQGTFSRLTVRIHSRFPFSAIAHSCRTTVTLASFVSSEKAMPAPLKTHNNRPCRPVPSPYCISHPIAKPVTDKVGCYNHACLLSKARLADWQIPQSNNYVQSNPKIHQPHSLDDCLV